MLYYSWLRTKNFETYRNIIPENKLMSKTEKTKIKWIWKKLCVGSWQGCIQQPSQTHDFGKANRWLLFVHSYITALFSKNSPCSTYQEKKKSASSSNIPHNSAIIPNLGKINWCNLFPLIDKYIPLPQNSYECIIIHSMYQ